MEAVRNFWDISNAILGHKYHSDQSNSFMSDDWSQNLQQKWALLQSVKSQYRINCFAHISALRKLAQCYWETRSGSNVNSAQAYWNLKDTNVTKLTFPVRPHDLLHPSPINSALCVVIMFVLVCLCRFLCQIIWFCSLIKGIDYPGNLHVVVCPNKQRSFESLLCLDLVSVRYGFPLPPSPGISPPPPPPPPPTSWEELHTLLYLWISFRVLSEFQVYIH